jgi:hypothetical protein
MKPPEYVSKNKVIAMRKILRLVPVVAVTLCAGMLLLPKPAQAWGRVGVFFGLPPIVVGPPVYYYPPPVFVPAPTYYAPVRVAPPGFTCYAGPYVCPLVVAHPINGPCSCPGNDGRVGGVAR